MVTSEDAFEADASDVAYFIRMSNGLPVKPEKKLPCPQKMVGVEVFVDLLISRRCKDL